MSPAGGAGIFYRRRTPGNLPNPPPADLFSVRSRSAELSAPRAIRCGRTDVSAPGGTDAAARNLALSREIAGRRKADRRPSSVRTASPATAGSWWWARTAASPPRGALPEAARPPGDHRAPTARCWWTASRGPRPRSPPRSKQAVGPGAMIVPVEPREGFDILPLLVATDGAIDSLGLDRRRFRPNLYLGEVPGPRRTRLGRPHPRHRRRPASSSTRCAAAA